MAGAERSFRQALDLQEALVRQNPHDLDLHSSLGGIYNNLGIVLEELHRTADAAKSYKQAVEHQQIASSNAPQVSRYRVFLSKHYYNYGRVLRRLGRPDNAARIARGPQSALAQRPPTPLCRCRGAGLGDQGPRRFQAGRHDGVGMCRACGRNAAASFGGGLEAGTESRLDRLLCCLERPPGICGIC